MKKYWIIMIVGLVFLAGCEKEEPLKPREGEEFNFVIPQGNNEFDTRIVNWHNRTGSYLLYKFSPRDAYWTKYNWTEAIPNSAGSVVTGTWTITPAKEEFVGKQLNLIEENFFTFYSDEFLKKTLPLRILLCDTLQDYYENKERPTSHNFAPDYLCFGWGNEKIDALTSKEIKDFRSAVNNTLINKAISAGLITVPKSFSQHSTYNVTVSNADKYKLGFLFYTTTATLTSEEYDFKKYIEAITSTSYDVLTAEPISPDPYPYFQGILHPNKDTNGLIRKKYDALIAYFNDALGIDIQAIGNKVD